MNSERAFPPSHVQSSPKRPQIGSREQHLEAVDRMLWSDLQRLFLEDLQSTHSRYSRDALVQRSQRVPGASDCSTGDASTSPATGTPPPNKKMVFHRGLQDHRVEEMQRALPNAGRAKTYKRLYRILRRFVIPLLLVNLILWAAILFVSVPSDPTATLGRPRLGDHPGNALEFSSKWVDSVAEFLGVSAPRLNTRLPHRAPPQGVPHHGQRGGAASPPGAVEGRRNGLGGEGIEQYAPHSAWFTMNHGAFPPPRASYLVGDGKPPRVVWFSRIYASPAVIITAPRNDTNRPHIRDQQQPPSMCRKVEAVRW